MPLRLSFVVVGRWLLWVPPPGKSLKKWWSSSGQNGITWWDIFLALASLTPCHPIPCLHPYRSTSTLLFLWLIITEVPVLNILRPSTRNGHTRFEKKKREHFSEFHRKPYEGTMFYFITISQGKTDASPKVRQRCLLWTAICFDDCAYIMSLNTLCTWK